MNKIDRTFRARAEERQQQYRTNILKTDYSQYGHFLTEREQQEGKNFVSDIAFDAAKERFAQGKGVTKRTFENMLSSQTMCFNFFAPLAADLDLASAVLGHVIPQITTVTSIQIEYTPPNDIFKDQSGYSGVDCDLLVQGIREDGAPVVIVIETKFVEPEFSICGFRVPGHEAKGLPVCLNDVTIAKENNSCLYRLRKRYYYWERTWEVGSLQNSALPTVGCPFGGPLWQLWVNYTLAKVEALRRRASFAIFAVCSPENNERLAVVNKLENFKKLLVDPDSVIYIGVDHLISVIGNEVKAPLGEWHKRLMLRYFNI